MMKRPDLSERNTTHGLSHLPEYDLWCGMKQRCYYKNHKSYAQYGGQGIGVCERWMSFENFYADMGKKPKGMTLDRINRFKDYSPDNCKWSSYKEQMRNTSRNRFIEHDGKVLCLSDWAKELGKTRACLGQRAHRGWSNKEILFGRNAA